MIWPEDRNLEIREPVEEKELGYPACGHCWYADGREEHGVWLTTDEEDLYCPLCGVEGE